jgi:hypothetical protein
MGGSGTITFSGGFPIAPKRNPQQGQAREGG